METEFKPKKLVMYLLLIHLVIYLCWSFVELSFTEPIIKTFQDNGSRLLYLLSVISMIAATAQYHSPLKDKE